MSCLIALAAMVLAQRSDFGKVHYLSPFGTGYIPIVSVVTNEVSLSLPGTPSVHVTVGLSRGFDPLLASDHVCFVLMDMDEYLAWVPNASGDSPEAIIGSTRHPVITVPFAAGESTKDCYYSTQGFISPNTYKAVAVAVGHDPGPSPGTYVKKWNYFTTDTVLTQRVNGSG